MEGSSAPMLDEELKKSAVEWTFALPRPASADDWLSEVSRAFGEAATASRLITEDGSSVVAQTTHEAAVLSALRNRGVTPAREMVQELFRTIDGMRNQLQAEDPHWNVLSSMPALNFSMSYVWTHLGIGAIAETEASDVMAACAQKLCGY